MSRTLIAIVLMLAGSIGASRAARAEESEDASRQLQNKLAQLAAEVVKVTKDATVQVGEFSPTDLKNANSGVGIEELLRAEFKKLSAKLVAEHAKFEVKGDYAFAKSRQAALAALKVVKIQARIIEVEFSEEVLKLPFTAEIDSTKSIAAILQPTVALDPHGKKEDRNQQIDAAVKAGGGQVFLHGSGHTLASSHADSPFAVEILAKSKDAPANEAATAKPLRVENNLAYVDLNQGDLYEIKVYNRAKKDVAVAVSIDGLSTYHFSEERDEQGQSRYTHLIVHPQGFQEDKFTYDGAATVAGWFRKLSGPDNVASFLVTGYGQGAVSQAGIKARGNVGVIHVQFADCAPLAPGQRATPGNETGLGPPRTVAQKAVSYDIEPPHDFVTIRYTRPQE